MKNIITRLSAVAISVLAGVSIAQADTLVVDILDVNSYDLYDDPSNEFFLIDVAGLLNLPSGTALHVNGIGWDVTIATVGASWLSEAALEITDSSASIGVSLAPGGATAAPGTSNFSSPVVDLVAAGLDFWLPDGLMLLQFYESYDDVPDSIDAIWNGSLEISTTPTVVPIPAAAWLLLSALLLLARRRRA